MLGLIFFSLLFGYLHDPYRSEAKSGEACYHFWQGVADVMMGITECWS